ncbi:MAG: GNAT family N-acetyltransferase [Hyphomicrobiaceae bacterium]
MPREADNSSPALAQAVLKSDRLFLCAGEMGTGAARLWRDATGALRAIAPPADVRPDWLWLDIWTGDQRVGAAGLLFQDDGPMEIGFRIEPEHRRRGYATEATRLLIALAFGALGESEIAADAAEDNLASHRTLLRLGFGDVGSGGQRWSERRGTYINYRRYRLVRTVEGQGS